MKFMVLTVCVFGRVERVANVVDFPKVGESSMIFAFGSFAYRKWRFQRIAHVSLTQTFSRVCLKDLTRVPGHIVAAFCCLSEISQPFSRAHVVSHTWLDRAPFPLPHTALRALLLNSTLQTEYSLRSASRTYVWPFCRTKPVHTASAIDKEWDK